SSAILFSGACPLPQPCIPTVQQNGRHGDSTRRLRHRSKGRRLRLLAAQAFPPAPAVLSHSSDQNYALASAPPLDSRATTAGGPILRCAVANSRLWSAQRPRESVWPNPQIRSYGPRPTTDGQSADKPLSNVDP